jgi:surface protein
MSISDRLQELISCKSDIKTAIEEKGVSVTGGLSTYADAVRSIVGGEGLDFSVLGFTEKEYYDNPNKMIRDDIAFSLRIKENPDWVIYNNGLTNNYYLDCHDTRRVVDSPSYNPYPDDYGDYVESDGIGLQEKTVYFPLIDTSKVKWMNDAFKNCTALQDVALLNTSNVTTMNSMFYGCTSLRGIPNFDTKNVTNMGNMFVDCKRITHIPPLNTENVTNMNHMFEGCKSLRSCPSFNTKNVTNMNGMFVECTKLESVPELDCGNCELIYSMFGRPEGYPKEVYSFFKLTDLGGFKDIGKAEMESYAGITVNLVNLPNLRSFSIRNVLNGLYPNENGYVRKLALNKYGVEELMEIGTLTDEDIAIATQKGWTVGLYEG